VQFEDDSIEIDGEPPADTAERRQPRLDCPIDFPELLAVGNPQAAASFNARQFRDCIAESRARGFVVVMPTLHRLRFSTS
jgi:hypothetical protein